MLFKFSFKRVDKVTRTNIDWKLVPRPWTGELELTIAKLGTHPADTKVTVRRDNVRQHCLADHVTKPWNSL